MYLNPHHTRGAMRSEGSMVGPASGRLYNPPIPGVASWLYQDVVTRHSTYTHADQRTACGEMGLYMTAEKEKKSSVTV